MEIIEAEYFSDHKLFNVYNYNKEYEVYNIFLNNLNEKNSRMGFIIKYVIDKYGIDIIPDNIFKDDFIIKSSLNINDKNLLLNIKSKYKLFLFKVIDFIFDNKNFIDIYNSQPEKIYKAKNSYLMRLWDYVYDVGAKKLEINSNFIYDDLSAIEINNNYEYLKKYDYNDVVKLLIFTYHCKYEFVSQNVEPEEINDNINDLTSYILSQPYDCFDPLFKYSTKVESFKFMILYQIEEKYKSLDSGYLWKQQEVFKELPSHGNIESINDKLVAYVYKVIKLGLVNKHIVEWVYLFLFNDLDKEVLRDLFDIILDISSDLDGLVSYILNSQNLIFNKINEDSLNNIIINLKESNKQHILSIDQRNVDNLEIVQKVNNYIFDIILNNSVDIISDFHKFNIDLNDLTFNECFFYNIIQKSPIEENITDLKISLELNNNQVMLKEKKNISKYVKTYNIYNLINASNCQKCKIIKHSTLTFVNVLCLTEFDVNFYFEKSAIKYEILKICMDLGFCPTNIPNLNRQIIEFVKNKKLSNIIYWLKDNNDEIVVEYILRKTNKVKEIQSIFGSFFVNNKSLFFKYNLNFD